MARIYVRVNDRKFIYKMRYNPFIVGMLSEIPDDVLVLIIHFLLFLHVVHWPPVPYVNSVRLGRQVSKVLAPATCLRKTCKMMRHLMTDDLILKYTVPAIHLIRRDFFRRIVDDSIHEIVQSDVTIIPYYKLCVQSYFLHMQDLHFWVRTCIETGYHGDDFDLKLNYHMEVCGKPYHNVCVGDTFILPEVLKVRQADRTEEQTAEVEEWSKRELTEENFVANMHEWFSWAVRDRAERVTWSLGIETTGILFRLE